MTESLEEATKGIWKKTSRYIQYLQRGDLLPEEFCLNVFELMKYYWLGKGQVEAVSLCVHRMPREILQLLSDFASFMPADYLVEDPMHYLDVHRMPIVAFEQAKVDMAASLRLLIAVIAAQLKNRGGPVRGEVVYALAKRIPGDPPLGFWGTDWSKNPYTAEDLAIRMRRYLDESDSLLRQKFDTIRDVPEMLTLFHRPDTERVWIVARVGPQVLIYNPMENRLEIGWQLSTGRIWAVCGENSLKILEKWPIGPIQLTDTIDIADVSTRNNKFDLMVAAYGHLDNSQATRTLLRRKIDFYIDQINFSDNLRLQNPRIILACDVPPVSELDAFLEEIRRQLEQQRIGFEIRTGAFKSIDALPTLRSVRDFVPAPM